jgi:hypothetical protein
MPLVSRPIPSLLNGVSQQPPSLRQASQCEQLVNALPSLAEGLQKRPPTYHVADVSPANYSSAYTTVLDFGGDEQYLVVLIDGDMFIYDKDGASQTIVFIHGKTYLNVTDPVTDFAVTSVEDIAYVVNKETVVDYDGITTAGGTYKGEKQTFADVVALGAPANGDVWRIVGDDTVVLTGYYVKYDGTAGTWKECPNVGVETTLDPAKMPYKLFKLGTNFYFMQETWGTRPAGSLTSLPEPNFIGRAIRDIFFFRNRLGVLAGDYCILSQSGPDYQNFFRQSATDTLDNDFIDLRAANIKVSALNHAVPFNKQLLMLSQGSQFILGTGAGRVLTPNTGAIDVATNYAANSVAKPVVAGNSTYFPSENTLFASLREYTVSDDTEVANTAEDVTAHVPSYIPAGVFKMVVAENDDMLFALTSGNQQRLYVYNYFWFNDEKLQNAWSYWEFDAATTILSIEIVGSSLFVLVDKDSDGCHLMRLDLKDDPSLTELGFVCHLDSRVLLTGVYSSGTGKTTFTTPYSLASYTDDDINLVKCGDWTSSYGALLPNPTIATSTTITVDGDYSTHDVYVGLKYTHLYRFSELFVREGNDPNKGQAILNGKLHLRTMNIRYSDTGYLRAEVTPRPGATKYQYSYNGMTVGAASLIIGTPNIDTGTFRFPVVAESTRVTIDLINDSHMPSAVVSAEWNGNYTPNAGRR